MIIIEDASRDRRPSKVVAAGDRASECTFFAQGVRKLSSEKHCRSNFCQHITRFYAKKCTSEIVPKISKIHPKSAPKSTKNVSGGTREQPRAPTKQQMDVFLDLFANTGPTIPMILHYFGSKNHKKCDRKNGQKRLPPKTTFFGVFLIFRASRARF